MHLFDTNRPELTSGTKTLLLDGSAVPHMLLQPEPDGMIKVQILLRHFDAHGGYGWHSLRLPSCDIGALLDYYVEDPEFVLREYFNWTDQRPIKPNVRVPTASPTAKPTVVSEMESLL